MLLIFKSFEVNFCCFLRGNLRLYSKENHWGLVKCSILDLEAPDPVPGADEPLGLVLKFHQGFLDLPKTWNLVKLDIAGRRDTITETMRGEIFPIHRPSFCVCLTDDAARIYFSSLFISLGTSHLTVEDYSRTVRGERKRENPLLSWDLDLNPGSLRAERTIHEDMAPCPSYDIRK